ncbi:O-antigen ligase family protein [Roseicyclus sp.]|uniref:O-antigen ligase family protein n=1 Tax=Roseicyclus sp. TaxID=1914329 RepID=UPI003F6C13AE
MSTTGLHRRIQGFFVAVIVFSLCATPALGSVTVLVMSVAMLIAIPVAVSGYRTVATGAKRVVWMSLIAYFISYVLIDAVIHGDLQNTFRAIAPSSPVLAAAIIAMALDPKSATISHRKLGEWASVAVLVSGALAWLILQTQPGWPILGRSVTDITGVNGRLSLFVGNPLPFAGAFLTLGFVSLLGWHERSLVSRIMAGAATILAILIVVFWSQSRGATVAAIPLLGLALWYLRPSRFAVLFALAALVVIMAVGVGLASNLDTLMTALSRLVRGIAVLFGEEPAMDSSTWQRLVMYRAGIAAWWDSPVFGYGISQRFSAAVPYFPAEFPGRYSHLHNTFITHAVAGGAIGLFFLCAVLATPFVVNRAALADHDDASMMHRRDRRYFAWMIFLSLIGIGMSGLILNQDVSANFLGTLLVAHLITQRPVGHL